MTLYWRPLRAVSPADYRIFLHLVDAKLGQGWGQFDSNGYPASQWHGDELVLSLFKIDVPDIAPSGKYNPSQPYHSGTPRLPPSWRRRVDLTPRLMVSCRQSFSGR